MFRVTPKRRAVQRERIEQTHVVSWFRHKYTTTLIVASANGGLRDKLTAALMKSEGVLAGMPDLMVCTARHGFHGLFMEFKPSPALHTKKKAPVSNSQKTRIPVLRGEGYYVTVCWGLSEAIKVLDWYMGGDKVLNGPIQDC